MRHWVLRRGASNDVRIVRGAGLRRRSIGASFGGGSRVGWPAQVQRDPPEALPVARPQPLARDRHRPLDSDAGKIVEAVIASLVGKMPAASERRLISFSIPAASVDRA
jgi:hypothetical protein